MGTIARLSSSRRRESTGAGAGGFVLPLLVLMVVAFDVPLVMMLGRSVLDPAPTLTPWVQFADRPYHLRILASTFGIGALTAIVCGVLGYPLAYWISQLPSRARAVATWLVVLPF